MISGMTGFGSAQVRSGVTKAIVEIKSLNHRYFDSNYYLPIGFASIENKILQIVKKEIKRGRVTISIKIIEKPQPTVALNHEVVEKYMGYARQLKRELKLINDLTLSHLIMLPGVMETKEIIVEPSTLWPALDKGTRKAVRELMIMRRREGKSLEVDIKDKLQRMKVQLKKITARSKVILQQQKKKLTIDEFNSFQKGADINEEISRMMHYVDEVRSLLKSNIPVGKKMDFIAQEMQRETNTIGSKMQDRIISNAVITLKSKIEKIREQAQNIE